MKQKPEKRHKRGLRLYLEKYEFDAIQNRTQNKLCRGISDATFGQYIENENVDGALHFSYNNKLINEEYFDLYGINLYNYNDGKFLFDPKDIKYLALYEYKFSFNDKITVEVTGISFEPSKNEDGSDCRLTYCMERKGIIGDADGELTMWYIVYHLGEIVSNDLELDFDRDDKWLDNCPF